MVLSFGKHTHTHTQSINNLVIIKQPCSILTMLKQNSNSNNNKKREKKQQNQFCQQHQQKQCVGIPCTLFHLHYSRRMRPHSYLMLGPVNSTPMINTGTSSTPSQNITQRLGQRGGGGGKEGFFKSEEFVCYWILTSCQPHDNQTQS